MPGKFRFGVAIMAVIASVFVAGYTVASRTVPEYVAAGQTRYALTQAEDAQTTQSTTFVNIPNLSVPFSVGSGKTAEAIMTFSGSMNGCNFIQVRAVIDGNAALPSQAQVFWNFSGGADSHGFTFFARNIGSGLHHAAIQWADPTGCNHAFISSRSLVLTVNLH